MCAKLFSGIGFKSVFLITAQPYIFSNGYQIRFNEEPCAVCNLGYIVPEWVEENPTLADLKQIYGSEKSFPTTTIVLPLKPDKVETVKQQLSSVHPEVLLFLTKIKELSVREDGKDSKSSTLTAVSISSETQFTTKKDIDAESFVLHLSANEKSNQHEECSYHMWRQRFPVKPGHTAATRMDVDEWVITLAFPNGDRLHRGTSSPGIYAFLPTEMITNLPFIIQADFILASSRETILLDKAWNQGILDCVPEAFVKAFISLVKANEDAPVFCLPPMFNFLPIKPSPYPDLNSVRERIKQKLMHENIIPCESYTNQRIFQKPGQVGRLMPAFWDLLKRGRDEGVCFHSISSHGIHILSSAFDMSKYSDILTFLGLNYVDVEWYAKCIRSSNFVLGVSEDLYVDLLLFLAENWKSSFMKSTMLHIPLLKYVVENGTVSLCSLYEASMLLAAKKHSQISWMINWNQEFRCLGGKYFLPKITQETVRKHTQQHIIWDWLVKQMNVGIVDMFDYASHLANSPTVDRELVLGYAHFLLHSYRKNFLTVGEVERLSPIMPLINNYKEVVRNRKGILVPAKGSRWLQLIGSNPWRREDYVELSEDYMDSGNYAGHYTGEKELMEFLTKHVGALDIPDLSPPDFAIPTLYSQLTKTNAFLLLDWIHNLLQRRTCLPVKFLRSIKEGSWMKISLNGISGCRPPSKSFLLEPKWANLLQNESMQFDIPLIDQKFYDYRIKEYYDVLRTIGVMFDFGEACQYIGNNLMSIAESSTLTRGNVFSILQFIKFLRERLLPTDFFIKSINHRKWLRTSRGDKPPLECVFFSEEWKAASQISNIPFLDKEYYGENILSYRTELEILGVVFGFNKSYKLVIDNLKAPETLRSFTAEAVLLVLQCMRHLPPAVKLVNALKNNNFLKTDKGYHVPAECFLYDPNLDCLLKVFNSFPVIDQNFYDNGLKHFESELCQLGVRVGFEEISKEFARVFKHQASLSKINKNNVLSLLGCYRKLKQQRVFTKDFKACIHEQNWLRTRLGDFKSPKECILFGPDWQSISSIAMLPFIDDSNNFYGKKIHEYKEELQSMGVVVSFRSGACFVANGLRLPEDSSSLGPTVAYALLECTRTIQEQHNEELLATLVEKVQKKWIKTYYGCKSPMECLLFGSDWESILQKADGPFIDETFYGSKITCYTKELKTLGVVVDVQSACPLVAAYLDLHSDFDTIVRIYTYLDQYGWKPTSVGSKRIWIPGGNEDGEWVSPEECVLHDRNGLFGFQYKVLDKHYKMNVLSFFSRVLKVKVNPSLDDYCMLWQCWEITNHRLSNPECCAFWGFVLKHWSSKTEKTVSEKLQKIPVYSSGCDGILLFDKHDVFIADDLYLKDLFEQSSSRPLFVWFPQKSLEDLPRAKLLEIYEKIGVPTLSESVQKDKLSAIDSAVNMRLVNQKEMFITRGLFKLVLGFLAVPSLEMEAKKRHEAVTCLLSCTVSETLEPITVGYNLKLSSGDVLDVKGLRMIRWDKQNSNIFSQKLDKSGGGQKNVLEYATNFAQVVSEGLLWGKEDYIDELIELIKLGFMVEFDEAAIEFLMKTKNLEIFVEDQEFLSSAFPNH